MHTQKTSLHKYFEYIPDHRINREHWKGLKTIIKISATEINSLEEYLTLMEDAGLISRLRDQAKGIIGLGNVEKVFLDNTNLIYYLSGREPEVGNIRETFFLNQMRVYHAIASSAFADFKIDKGKIHHTSSI